MTQQEEKLVTPALEQELRSAARKLKSQIDKRQKAGVDWPESWDDLLTSAETALHFDDDGLARDVIHRIKKIFHI